MTPWVTIAEADTYFLTKWGASAWASLVNLQKEQLLSSAYNWIKSLYSISDSSTDPKIKRAQYELAWYIYNFYDEHLKHQALNAQGVKSFSIMSFSETLTQAVFPPFIADMLPDDALASTGGKIVSVHRDLST